jgi:hypothetical protein
MGVDATEGEMLMAAMAGLPKSVVIEASVVAMIVLDADAVLGGEVFECTFGSNGLDRRIANMKWTKGSLEK